MTPLEELKLHTKALLPVVEGNPKFFAAVQHYLRRLDELLSGADRLSQSELQILVSKLDGFWSEWRPIPGSDSMYIPPRDTADTDSTVRRMRELVDQLVYTDESEFMDMADSFAWANGRSSVEPVRTVDSHLVGRPCVFIGHGRNRVWAVLQLYLQNELGLATVTYESESSSPW